MFNLNVLEEYESCLVYVVRKVYFKYSNAGDETVKFIFPRHKGR